MSDLTIELANNPERLSKVERDRREAEDVARHTGRTVVLAGGEVAPSKVFVEGYMELLEKLDR